jgi:ribonuclease BN (tRNA processing enzyme)
MQITILGSGTLVPTGVRGPAGYAVRTDGTTFLLDSGSGTLRRLWEAGIDYTAIDHLFYSHVHPDHSSDLVPFLFAQRHIPPPAPPRTRDLTLHGPRGFAAFYRQLALVYGRWVAGEGYAIHVEEHWGSGVSIGPTRIEAHPMRHTVACVGYRITSGAGSIAAYTGDTDVTPAVSELGRDADLLIADCSMPDEAKIEGHLTPGLAGELAAAGGVKLLVLSHFYPACDPVDVVAQCRRHYAGPIIRAEDLMRIDLEPGAPPRIGRAGR